MHRIDARASESPHCANLFIVERVPCTCFRLLNRLDLPQCRPAKGNGVDLFVIACIDSKSSRVNLFSCVLTQTGVCALAFMHASSLFTTAITHGCTIHAPRTLPSEHVQRCWAAEICRVWAAESSIFKCTGFGQPNLSEFLICKTCENTIFRNAT